MSLQEPGRPAERARGTCTETHLPEMGRCGGCRRRAALLAAGLHLHRGHLGRLLVHVQLHLGSAGHARLRGFELCGLRWSDANGAFGPSSSRHGCNSMVPRNENGLDGIGSGPSFSCFCFASISAAVGLHQTRTDLFWQSWPEARRRVLTCPCIKKIGLVSQAVARVSLVYVNVTSPLILFLPFCFESPLPTPFQHPPSETGSDKTAQDCVCQAVVHSQHGLHLLYAEKSVQADAQALLSQV